MKSIRPTECFVVEYFGVLSATQSIGLTDSEDPPLFAYLLR